MSGSTERQPDLPFEVQYTLEVGGKLDAVLAKLTAMEETMEEILVRMDELELPYASLHEDE